MLEIHSPYRSFINAIILKSFADGPFLDTFYIYEDSRNIYDNLRSATANI